jgi:hypothetical protein
MLNTEIILPFVFFSSHNAPVALFVLGPEFETRTRKSEPHVFVSGDGMELDSNAY